VASAASATYPISSTAVGVTVVVVDSTPSASVVVVVVVTSLVPVK